MKSACALRNLANTCLVLPLMVETVFSPLTILGGEW